MRRITVVLLSLAVALWPPPALAHCPLCTAGIGAAALVAAWLGVGTTVIGIFIGALGLTVGLWIGRLIRRNYVPHQGLVIGAVSWITTVIPLTRLLPDYTSLYLPMVGEYGRTYPISRILIGAVIGAVLLGIAPTISRAIGRARGGRILPFQGVGITLLLLLLAALATELML